MNRIASVPHNPKNDWEIGSRNVNILRPERNGSHFTQDIFNSIFDEKRHFIKITMKFVVVYPTGNNSALIRVMYLYWVGDKPLPEAMLNKISNK